MKLRHPRQPSQGRTRGPGRSPVRVRHDGAGMRLADTGRGGHPLGSCRVPDVAVAGAWFTARFPHLLRVGLRMWVVLRWPGVGEVGCVPGPADPVREPARP